MLKYTTYKVPAVEEVLTRGRVPSGHRQMGSVACRHAGTQARSELAEDTNHEERSGDILLLFAASAREDVR
jgi:hypothetical protein